MFIKENIKTLLQIYVDMGLVFLIVSVIGVYKLTLQRFDYLPKIHRW